MAPRISEFPRSLRVGASRIDQRATEVQRRSLTFLDILPKVDDFSAYGRDKEVCDLLFGVVVSTHQNEELGLVSDSMSSEYGACKEVRMWGGGDKSIELASKGRKNLGCHLSQQR